MTQKSFESNSDFAVDISIVILTRNQEKILKKSLPLIFSQKHPFACEVVVMNTDSTDGTKDLLSKFEVRLFNIRKNEFHHAKTRNLGVRLSRGRYIVFLTGDAVPLDKMWLNNLVCPLIENPKIAASYSRQIANPNCHPVEARFISETFGGTRAIKHVDFSDSFQSEGYRKNVKKFIIFSNVSSCYRKSLLLDRPFREDLPSLEDQEWCKYCIEKGWSFQYEPLSVVIHSHTENPRQIYKKFFNYGLAAATFLPQAFYPGKFETLRKMAVALIGDYRFLLTYRASKVKKIIWLFTIPFCRIVRYISFKKGFKRGVKNKIAAES